MEAVQPRRGNHDAVGGALVDTKLDALAKLLVELLVVVRLLGNLSEHLQALLDQVLLDDAKNLVLLETLTGDVERQIRGVDHTLDEVQPLRHELIAVVHDEDAARIQLDVVALLLGHEEVERSTTRDEQQGAELRLTQCLTDR